MTRQAPTGKRSIQRDTGHGCGARPILLGHRGARALRSIPENTLASFDRAIDDGCDGFEFDVRLSADSQAVISHDPVCGDHKTGRLEIARSTAKQLAPLVSLPDILARYRKAFLDIELKVAGLEKIAIEHLRKERPRRFVVSSFLPQVLTDLQALERDLPLGLICETKTQMRCWPRLFIDYVILHHTLVRRELIEDFHAAKKKVIVWTVNSEREMKRFAAWNVDGIISDDTKRLYQTLG